MLESRTIVLKPSDRGIFLVVPLFLSTGSTKKGKNVIRMFNSW